MRNLIALVACVSLTVSLFTFKLERPKTVEQMAEYCNLSVEEFVLISSVTEAESNRQQPAEGELTTEGRILIAVCIFNRVESDLFNGDTVTEILTAPGQFSTVRNGNSVTERTEWSDWAVIEAYNWCQRGDQPQVLFFNCIGYNYGEPYGNGPIGGNYFMTMES